MQNSVNNENKVILGHSDNLPTPPCPICPCVLFVKDDSRAVTPTKGTPFSVGYDLTILSFLKRLTNRTALYDTGIVISPPEGYYVEILPRSSLSKTGYIIANSTGIIDPDYRGRLLVALAKIDDSCPDLEFPCTKFQMVLRKHEVFNMCQVDSLDNTERGSGGFGSTDRPVSEECSSTSSEKKI